MSWNNKSTRIYAKCPVCQAGNPHTFFELFNAPINVCVQWPTREEALQCPKADIRLVFCKECEFIWNAAFDAASLNYTQAYENSLFFSPLFQQYSHALAQRLIDRYNLRNKDVIDIGCGKGDFLFLLCKLGNNRGIGFDTSYEGTPDGCSTTDERVTVIRDFYSKKYADCKGDLICSRYVFEHIQQPVVFLNTIRDAIGQRKNVTVYFEVPNVSLILRDLSVWDIIYEHCSYFSLNPLKRIFKQCGFDVLDAYESYQGQFLGIEAKPSNSRKADENLKTDTGKMAQDVDDFMIKFNRQLESWQDSLKHLEESGKKAVLWGAGAKGVSFLNMLGIVNGMPYIVDINPRKHGKYIAGTGQKIVPPEFLAEYKPDILIIPNPIYKDEIQAAIKKLGINPEIM
jgi:SAM-dependent methyltransferase